MKTKQELYKTCRVKEDTDNLTLSYVAGCFAGIKEAIQNPDGTWSYSLEGFFGNKGGARVQLPNTRIAYVHERDLEQFCL